MEAINLKNMRIQLEELIKRLKDKNVTGYFHPSDRKIKRSDIFINEKIPELASIMNTEKSFIIEGWVLFNENNNFGNSSEKHSIYVFRENDKYNIKELNIDKLSKEEDNAFIQEFNFKADNVVSKISGIKLIKMKKVFKIKKNNDFSEINEVKPYCYYFDGFE